MRVQGTVQHPGEKAWGEHEGASLEGAEGPLEPSEGHLLRTLSWVSAGLTALALGVVVGREIRQRYRFTRRTPYDFYAHSGDQVQDVDFGVGI